MQKVVVAATIDLDAQRWNMQGSIDGLEVSPEMRAILPPGMAEKLDVLGGLRGTANLTFQARREEDMPAPVKFDVQAELLRGRIDDPRLPYPLTDLKARVKANNDGFAIDELTAANGRTTLQFACQRRGSGDHAPMTMQVSGRHLLLDQQLVKLLPEAMRADWTKYLPEGEVDADIKLAYDGNAWQPDVDVRCLNVAFTYHKFPYRLERTTGQIYVSRSLSEA